MPYYHGKWKTDYIFLIYSIVLLTNVYTLAKHTVSFIYLERERERERGGGGEVGREVGREAFIWRINYCHCHMENDCSG